MCNYVRPDKVMYALKCWKLIIRDIDINNVWINDELIKNSEFVNPYVDNTNEINETSINMQNPADPMTVFTARAKGRGFTIHDVPGNGNCLFHAVSYQLPNFGIRIDANTLRT